MNKPGEDRPNKDPSQDPPREPGQPPSPNPTDKGKGAEDDEVKKFC